MERAYRMSIAHLLPSRATLPRRLALVVAVAFASTAVATFAHPSAAFAWDENAFSSAAEHDLVALTNQSRAAAGRRALHISATLSSIARWRSKDMVKRDYFSHSIPGYGNVFKKISASGFCYHLAGENIGWTPASDSTATARIHQMFMDSSSHRANILGKAWDSIGVGAYKAADGRKMYTVLFADKCGSATKTTTKVKPKPKPKPHPAQTKPRATPRPKPKPTPRPTPAPTPVFSVPQATDRAEPSGDADTADATAPAPTPADTPVATEPAEAARPVTGDGHGLRVMDASSPPGLLDTIVGGVSGALFGT